MTYSIKPLTPGKIRTYPLSSRPSKVSPADFARPPRRGESVSALIAGLPGLLSARDFKELLDLLRRARSRKKPVIWAMGAHVIKAGLSPVLIDLMKDGWVSGLALNGAGIIHDFELAFAGRTSEDVAAQIRTGRFGMAEETGEMLNRAITEGGLRAIYWDILYMQHFATVQNGMAYELPDGRVQPQFNGFN
ncbi:MAG: hypothetical protein NTW38_02305, partial [Candidatus Aminicenantes bacterium]|nr:hypothetical protein [Candidatus Aminicenantes bacterium]